MISIRVLFLILLLSGIIFPQKLRFAVWGDSQFQNPEVFEEIVRKTELLKPEFVIHVGDMIHGYTYNIDQARKQWKRFKKQIAPLTSPFYPTPGNHDVTTKEIQPAYLEAWGKDKLYYSFDYGSAHFIIINTYLHQNFDTIPSVEIEWLKKDLEMASGAENIFISMHSPLHLNRNYNWQPVHDILKKYPVKAVFTGHYHYYDYRVIDGIKYFCLNSSGNMGVYNEMAGRSHNFLWVTVDQDPEYTVITRNNFYPPDFVLPGEISHSSYLESNQTIIVNTSSGYIDTTLDISIKNNSEFSRQYFLKPSFTDTNWVFSWDIFNTVLDQGEETRIPVRVSYKGNVESSALPFFEIRTDHINQKNIRTDHNYKISLFNPPVAFAYRTSEKIIPDGDDSEAAWKTAKGISGLYTDKANNPAEHKTEVKVLYDDQNIYVFVEGEEPNPEGLSSEAYGDIPLVFGDDDFELYFDTNRDLKTFYRLMVNPDGTILSSSPEGRFTFDFDVKTRITKISWAAEFLIPLKEIKVNSISRGDIWGFNVRRHRQQSDIPQSDWSKMNTYPPYQPEYFGLLIFN